MNDQLSDNLLDFELQLADKRIFITGHTGFTGGWVCTWLNAIGANISGFSLPPDTNPSLFKSLELDNDVETTNGDICETNSLCAAVQNFQPDLILHLAAQPLVRRSYRDPITTFSTNVMGTANVLEIARNVASVRGVLCVTTDKVYNNREWQWPYRENDILGGKDPYSASKSAAEMVIYSYSHSFPFKEQQGPAIAVARGGNIIGGGDWAEDRLIPDFVRAVVNGGKLTIRYPDATRPWQHVLALAYGYLVIMANLISNPARAARAWNLGPTHSQQYSVREVLELIGNHWQTPSLDYMDHPLPEAGTLALDSTLAQNLLGWAPVWDTKRMVEVTADWYRRYYENPSQAKTITQEQIIEWRKDLGA